MTGYLVLESGEIFEGERIGAFSDTACELVYNTSMNGYLEIFSDPAYLCKGIVMQYPLIGNIGVNEEDLESYNVYANCIIVHEIAEFDNNFRKKQNLNKFLRDYKVPGLTNVDTKRLIQEIKSTGSVRAYLTSSIDNMKEISEKIKRFDIKKPVRYITTQKIVKFGTENEKKIALIDYGFKHSLVNEFLKNKIGVTVCPSNITIGKLLELNPNGVVISNGPGNPEEYTDEISFVKDLCQKNIPILGIGLGYEIIALANGFEIAKLNEPHRGSNYTVKDVRTGKIFTTLQNQEYYIKKGSIKDKSVKITHINLNDNTVAGIEYMDKNIMAVQFNPEAGPGSDEAKYIIEKFIDKL